MARVPESSFTRRAVATASFAFALVACGAPEKTVATPGQPVDPAAKGNAARLQDSATRDVDGRTIRLSDYAGKRPIMLTFWSTYCQPCLAMFPHVRRIHDKYFTRGLVVLAVSMDPPESVANVPSYVQRNNLNALTVLYDEDSHVASLYNPKKVEPFVIIIDRRGNIVKTHEAYNTGDEVLLEEAVKAAVE